MTIVDKIRLMRNPENIIYLVLWIVIVLLPIGEQMLGVINGQDDDVEWTLIFLFWVNNIPIFILFLVNNNFLLPRLLLRHKTWQYINVVVVSLVLTMAVSNAINHLFHEHYAMPHKKERIKEIRESQGFAPPPKPDNRVMPYERGRRPPLPPGITWRHFGPMLAPLLLGIMTLVANIAIKLFFRSIKDKERMKELETHNLQSELQYLKHQVNPHFFMNTLNNIHALVDIDSERAKETIVELSKLMRYMLYETDRKYISLVKEVEFLNNYVKLMQIRYPDDILKITLDMPDDVKHIVIPPLMFISFVENAFKHGVSYRMPSEIRVSIKVDGEVISFECTNTVSGQISDQHHGIGLTNVKKRLQLLYEDDYSLSINDDNNLFEVRMILPTKTVSS